MTSIRSAPRDAPPYAAFSVPPPRAAAAATKWYEDVSSPRFAPLPCAVTSTRADTRQRAAVAAPVMAGSSRCTGNVYLGLFEYLERHVPGGVAAVLGRLRDPELIQFASQRFLAASWYDFVKALRLGEAAAVAARLPYAQLMTAVGTAQAERDIRGVYQYLLRFASPAAIIERLPRVARQYFDFVTSELLTRPATSPATLLLTGLPESLAPTYALLSEPFLRRALTLAGATSVDITISAFEPYELDCGRRVVRFTRRISWT